MRVYQNNRNNNKYIEVKRYSCGHYVFKQYIKTNERKQYTGCILKQVYKGVWHRVSKVTLDSILEDYKEV